MIRARSFPQTLTPGCFLVIAGDGRSWQSPMVATPNARRIKSLYDSSGAIGVEFYEAHGYTASSSVYCRVSGWDEPTQKAHQANNWSASGTTRHPTTGVPSSASGSYDWGGAPWSITVATTTKIVLTGSTYSSSSVFYDGYCYTSQTNARNTLQGIYDDLAGVAAEIYVGPGFYFWTSGGSVEHPSNVKLIGAHKDLVHFASADFFNDQIITVRCVNWQISDLTLHGNRAFMGQARHAMRIGDDDTTKPVRTGLLARVKVTNSGGYAINVGKHAEKSDLRFEDVHLECCNNDAMDVKNKGNTNRRNFLVRHRVTSPGLGTKGTMRGLNSRAMGSNPVATTNGATTVSLTLPFKPLINQSIYVAGLTAVNGVTVSGWYRVTNKSGFVATIETGQTASGTSSGGGSSGTIVSVQKLPGSPGFDLRGPGWTVQGAKINGELDQCVGARFRGGTTSNNNGEGAHRSTMSDVIVEDETAYSTSTMKALSIAADYCVMSNCTVKGIGGSSAGESFGLFLSGESSGAVVRGLVAQGVRYAVYNSGAKASVDVEAIDCGYGVYSDGDAAGTEGALDPTTPFTVSATGLSPSVLVLHETAHGFSGGETITYDGALRDATIGLDMNDTFTVGTIVNTLSYYVTATGQTALATGSWGGEDVTFSVPAVSKTTSGNEYKLRSFGALAAPVYVTTTNSGAKVYDSHSANDAAGPTDNGTGTIWGPGNSGGLPNLQTVYALPTSGSVTLYQYDSGKVLVLPSNASGIVEVTLPSPSTAPVSGWWADVLCNAGSGTVGVKFITPSGTIIDGNNASSSGGSITSSTSGARGRINQRSSTGFAFGAKTGTWTLA